MADDVLSEGNSVDSFDALRRELEAERLKMHGELVAVLSSAGAAACTAYASVIYSQKDARTYRESTDDQSAAHLEYLGLQALPLLLSQPTTAASSIMMAGDKALQLVRAIFSCTQRILVLRAPTDSDFVPAHQPFRDAAMIESLYVRGFGYKEHLEKVFMGCLEPFDDDCSRHLGFSATQAWALTFALPLLIQHRLRNLSREAARELRENLKDLKRLRRAGQLPVELRPLTPTQQKNALKKMAVAQMFAEPLPLAVIGAEELSQECGVPIEVAAAWLEFMHCEPSSYNSDWHKFPVGVDVVRARPLLKVDGGYLAPSPVSILEALRPRIEDGLKSAGMSVWNKYTDHRGKWLERVSTDLIAGALKGSDQWRNVEWASPTDASDIDGLVAYGEATIRIQCKSGRISESARRGAPSVLEDLSVNIAEAMGQHVRVDNALKRYPGLNLGFTAEQADCLAAPMCLDVIVTLDDITAWATEAHLLRTMPNWPETDRHSSQVPWVVSLNDLMVTVDLLKNSELIHYWLRRLRLEAEERIFAHDEIDWVGNYLLAGLYFDSHFAEGELDWLRLDSHTETIDRWYFFREGLLGEEKVAKPHQPIPMRLHSLIRRLESDRPPRWLIGCLMLLDGDGLTRERMDEGLEKLRRDSLRNGWAHGTMPSETCGLTFSCDFRGDPMEAVRNFGLTVAEKSYASGLSIPWVLIGQTSNGISTSVFESLPGQIFRVLSKREH